jgi:TrpR family trp operon transcriptional repressor
MSNKKSSKAWQEFLALCAQQKTPQDFEFLLSLFLTYEERADLTTRYSIVKELLEAKLTQRTIAKELDVSIAKITRGSNELKTLSTSQKKKLMEMLLK